MTEADYRALWKTKTKKQIKNEIEIWHKIMGRHHGYYAWATKWPTKPGELASGDQVEILKEILNEKKSR